MKVKVAFIKPCMPLFNYYYIAWLEVLYMFILSSLLTNHCHEWNDNYSRRNFCYSKFTFLMTARFKLYTTTVCC